MVNICKFLIVVFKHGAFFFFNIYIREKVTVEVIDYIIPFQNRRESHTDTKSSDCLLFYFSTD